MHRHLLDKMYNMSKNVTTLPAAQAKQGFADALRLVEKGRIVVVTRYGKPVAGLVPPSDLERLERLRSATPLDGLAGLVGRWPDAEEFADLLDQVVADRTPPREPPRFD